MPILEGYGLSESSSTATFNISVTERKVYSVGKPIWGTSLQIWDEESRPLPPGADHVGEVVLRGMNIMTGYYDNPEATAKAFAGGWFHTGDLGYIDEDGFLFIVDRIKDLIIRGGYNVYPREIEEVLYAHPAVAEAAVIGVPDPKMGEEVRAIVAVKPGQSVTEAELIEFVKERAPPTSTRGRSSSGTACPRAGTRALEDHRVLRLLAQRLARPPDLVPRHRQRPQLLHRADRQPDRGRERGQVAVVSRPPSRATHAPGSTTMSAPQAVASSRRPAEKSLATTVPTPCALSIAMTARPTGPQPITIASSPFFDLRPADRVPADRERLGQHRQLGRQPVREREHQRLLDHHPLGVAARRRRREADRVHLVAPPGERHRHHRRPGRDLLPGAGPVAGDLADELVPEHHLLTGSHEAVVADRRQRVRLGVGVQAGVQVGPADAAAEDVEDDLAGGGLRISQLDQLELGMLDGDSPHQAPAPAGSAVVERRQRLDQRRQQLGRPARRSARRPGRA